MSYLTNERIEVIRKQNAGVALGTVLTEYATDEEISRIVELRDEIAYIHNSVLSRLNQVALDECKKGLK